jgi:hypothetical protein
MTAKTNPTTENYSALTEAYRLFNRRLFKNALPDCLITLQRKGGTYGYFAGERFGSADGAVITDEIAMNPSHFKSRTAAQVLSTLAHEMAHLWQHHHGKPKKSGYHDKQWAGKMREIGLIPSTTGAPGGKETGHKVSHYIEQGGAFDKICAELLTGGFVLPYVELWDEAEAKKRKAKAKTKFSCPDCGANAWGKPELKIVCGECDVPMRAEESGDDTG